MNETTMNAGTRLALRLKNMESCDQTALIRTANQYTYAKRTGGNVQAAYGELFRLIKTTESKYGFSAFENCPNLPAVIDEFADRVERGTAKTVGAPSYTCHFANVDAANAWLDAQRNVVIKRLSISASGAGNDIHDLMLEYTVSPQIMRQAYRLTELKKTRLYTKSNPEKVKAQWQNDHPQFRLITSVKHHWRFGLWGGHVGYFRMYKEKYVILYAYNRA